MHIGISDYLAYEDWAKVNPVTGDLYRRDRKGAWYLSQGTLDHWGYRVWSRHGKIHKGHHIVWVAVHGCKPSEDIDHINGDRGHNAISNLRLASRGQNNANATMRVDNKSGVKGLYWCAQRQRWQANVALHGEQRQKRFINRDDAVAWIDATRNTLHGEYQYDGTTDRK